MLLASAAPLAQAAPLLALVSWWPAGSTAAKLRMAVLVAQALRHRTPSPVMALPSSESWFPGLKSVMEIPPSYVTATLGSPSVWPPGRGVTVGACSSHR